MNTSLTKSLDEIEQEVIREIELEFNHEDLKRHLETQLIKYLKKDFHMNPIFKLIKSKLKNKEEITDKQFESIIKFIERELPFRGQCKNRIYDYFSPVIRKTKDKIVTNSLEQFFV